jgi:hypothetical protein
MTDSRPYDLALRLELFAKEIFKAQNFKVDDLNRLSDFVATSPSGARAVVEVKLYRSRHVAPTFLRNAALQLDAARSSLRADRGVLVTASRVGELGRAELQALPNLVLYDLDVLAMLVGQFPALARELEDIVREAYPARPDAPRSMPVDIPDISKRTATPSLSPQAPQAQPVSTGEELCTLVDGIPAGRAGAQEFEAKCTEALRYIFEDDFVSWRRHRSTDSRMHQFDLVAKISSENDFWNSLISDFRSRYIVFEFKNYEGKISQAQIYSTEKYLHPIAMRATSIIISREGADENALSACRGALREAGKLILNINISQLCEMLRRKDKGDDAWAVLADMLDLMLIGIER